MLVFTGLDGCVAGLSGVNHWNTHYGDQLDPWLVKAQKVISLDSHATVRASRGSARVKVPEVSIAVKQVPGSPVPDGRDFHRALVGVYLSMSRAMLNKPL